MPGREERENGTEAISEETAAENLRKGIKEAQSIVITTKNLVTSCIN